MKAKSGSMAVLAAVLVWAASAGADEFARIPAGDFQVDRTVMVGDEWLFATNTVYVSEFEIARYPVTKALWDEVRAWAVTNGYTGLPAGNAKATNHPVRIDKWYHAIQWCNARSEKEQLTPAYYTGSNLTTVLRAEQVQMGNDWVRWGANGYRLPTEAEFWKAFRGGLEYSLFPWGDVIAHSNANYYSTNSYPYDVSPTRGYHPAFVDTNSPPLYTSPVGYFPPNGYGLYDMAGNTRQFLWDRGRYSGSPSYWEYWGNPPRYDPKGLGDGDVQFAAGGNWDQDASRCTAFRFFDLSVTHNFNSGFRLARSLPPEIENAGFGPPGFEFDVAARWEPTVVIQARTNLIDGGWNSIASTNVPAGSHSIRFLDPDAQTFPRRFYRIILP